MADNKDTGPLPELSDKEKKDAQKQGVKEAITESIKRNNTAIDELPGEDEDGSELHNRFRGSDEVLGLEPYQDLSPDEFEKAIGLGKKDEAAGLTDVQLGSLYKLERNGRNRTPYVQALRKKLKLDKGEHVPGAGGPGFTNDVTDLSDL